MSQAPCFRGDRRGPGEPPSEMSAAPGRGLASGFHHPQTQGFLGHCHPRLHPLPCGHLPGPEVGCLCTAAGRHCPSTQRPHSPPESSSRHPSPGRHPGSPFGPSLLPTWAHSSHPAVTEASGTVGEAHPPGLPRNAGHPSDRSDPRGRTGTYAEEVWESWGAPGVLEGTLLPAHRPALAVTLTALPPVSPGVTSVRSGEAQSETSGGGTGVGVCHPLPQQNLIQAPSVGDAPAPGHSLGPRGPMDLGGRSREGLSTPLHPLPQGKRGLPSSKNS